MTTPPKPVPHEAKRRRSFLKIPLALPQHDETAARAPIDEQRSLALNTIVGGASNFAKMGIQFLLLPILARLLGPTEFGLYSLAIPTVSFFIFLADGGLGASLAREDESSTEVWSTAFWVLLALGVVLGLVTFCWGIVLAHLARVPKLSEIMGVLSFTFIFISISVLPTARMMRSGNLVAYAAADFLATFVGAIVAVCLALLQAGAMSLAVQYVVVYAVRALVLNLVASYRPRREFKLSSLHTHLMTGGFLLGGRLVEFASRLSENLIFGRTFGAAALGTYTFANQVPRFICEAASNPTWSALYSRALRDDPWNLGAPYRKLCRFLALVTFPVAALLASSAPRLIEFVLGAKWELAAPLIQILVPAYAISVVASQGTAILLSNGRNVAFLTTLAGQSAGRVLAVCSGYWLGPTGVAWGILITNLLYAAAMFVLPARTMSASAWHVLPVLVAPTVASAVGGVICYVVLSLEPAGVVPTFIGLLAGGLGFLVTLIVMEGPILKADLLNIRRMFFRQAALD
jgi:PST family polysaccharide transporter